MAGMVDSDDEAGDGDGFGANAAVRVAQPQVTLQDNVSQQLAILSRISCIC